MRIRRSDRTPRHIEPTWVSYRDATRLFLRGATLPTAVRISVVVGTWLSLMNQGGLIVDGHPPWVKLVLQGLAAVLLAIGVLVVAFIGTPK